MDGAVGVKAWWVVKTSMGGELPQVGVRLADLTRRTDLVMCLPF